MRLCLTVTLALASVGCLQPTGTPIYGSTTLPAVVSTVPSNGQTNVPVNFTFQVEFSELMASAETQSAIQIIFVPDSSPVAYDALGSSDSGTSAVGAFSDVFGGTPKNPLYHAQSYALSIGQSAVDENGNSLSTAVTVNFQTQ
jgi:hypothetical protein